jgi:high frequency lysogenization protein
VTKLQNITIALGGMLQAATLVNEIAHYGSCNIPAFEASLESLYKIDSDTVESVYGGVENIRLGLIQLDRLLRTQPKDFSKLILRYVIGFMHLEKYLQKRSSLTNQLKTDLERISGQVNFFSNTHDVIIHNIATSYRDIFNKSAYKIVVRGKKEYLVANDIQERVRALLLAGIRSAVLWRQLGGNRLQLILQRNRIAKEAMNLIKLDSH